MFFFLTLRELESPPCTHLTVFLAFFHSAVTSEKTAVTKRRQKVFVVVLQRSGDAQKHCAGLTGWPAAFDIGIDIKLLFALDCGQRRKNRLPILLLCKVFVELPFIDYKLSFALFDSDTGT